MRDAPLTTAAVEQFMKKHVKLLGYPGNITPHSLRHSFAVHLLENGVSQTFIQQLLGHKSPGSTECYMQMTSKALMGIVSPFDSCGGGGGHG
jgi:site-specific recombinase XerD